MIWFCAHILCKNNDQSGWISFLLTVVTFSLFYCLDWRHKDCRKIFSRCWESDSQIGWTTEPSYGFNEQVDNLIAKWNFKMQFCKVCIASIKLPLRQTRSTSLFYVTTSAISETERHIDPGDLYYSVQSHYPGLKLWSFSWFYKAFSHSSRHCVFSLYFFNIHLHK